MLSRCCNHRCIELKNVRFRCEGCRCYDVLIVVTLVYVDLFALFYVGRRRDRPIYIHVINDFNSREWSDLLEDPLPLSRCFWSLSIWLSATCRLSSLINFYVVDGL